MGGYYDAGNAYEPASYEPSKPVYGGQPSTYGSIIGGGLLMSGLAAIGGTVVGGLLGVLVAKHPGGPSTISEVANNWAITGSCVGAGIVAVVTLGCVVGHALHLRNANKTQADDNATPPADLEHKVE